MQFEEDEVRTRCSVECRPEPKDNDTRPSRYTILNSVFHKLSDVTEEETLRYHHIDVETARDVMQELERSHEARSLRLSYNSRLQELKLVLMSSPIHDSHQPWVVHRLIDWTLEGLLLPQQANDLRVLGGTRFSSFGTPYASSYKEPDQCIWPKGLDLPTVVVESGWSESRFVLHTDRDLWLLGGSGIVQVVMILTWSKNEQGRVEGDIELFDLDASGSVRSLQQEIIFPRPPPMIAATQFVNITRSQLFGPTLPVDQDPGTIFALSIDSLRVIAEEFTRGEGLIPA
ncbi:conserved hypothetical protein [Paecilomyces variotii No. 5]|uniref:Uncharacterized protein n=1 Tax=Byssochlamys spectabilis (strain No. 5 / NBRC 109023) TaxID=1356009 RepID=V5FZD9_BYSSN|nr:conserved hypothetical protein [Paecilomyces variotii No. 5]